ESAVAPIPSTPGASRFPYTTLFRSSFWHWALGADGGHGHAQPPFRSSRLIGAERQPTSDCRQSLQQSPAVRLSNIGIERRVRKRSEEHTSELQSRFDIVCRLLLEKK